MAAADVSIDLNSTVGSTTTDVDNMDAEEDAVFDTPLTPSATNVKQMISEDTKKKLVGGLVDLYEPDLNAMHERVKEVLRNQGVLLDSTQNELTQLKECTMLNDIIETFENVKIYHKKLVTIKKDMHQLSERANKVKVRAHKLQVQKEKDELALASERERQMIYEKELAAKPAAEYFPNT